MDTNFTWDATGLTGTWGIAPSGDTAQVQWQFPVPGIYNLVVTATNSAGQGVINVRLRVMPFSRAWNIRRSHTSLLTCTWRGQTRTGPVWGSGYSSAGYSHLPYVLVGLDDFVGNITSYVVNGDFVYLAGSTDYQAPLGVLRILSSRPGPDGAVEQLPDGLLSRAAITQQIQGWVQQARDAVEMLNDYIGAFDALLQNQFAQFQYESELCRLQAEWAASRTWLDDLGDAAGQMWQGVMDAVESDWEFLGIRGRKGGIEFGDLFAIEWAGYGDRAEATWGGALFMAGDTISAGAYYTDEDRAEMYGYYAARGLGDYYIAGGITGSLTVTAATAIATGGASTFSAGAGATVFMTRSAAVVRTTASTIMVAESGYSGYQAGTALGEVANGGEWTTETSIKVGAFGLGMGGAGAGRALGRLRTLQSMPRFTQTTASATFRNGPFAGKTIGEVVAGLRQGTISPRQLPVDTVFRNGQALALNTRSVLALKRAGIDPSRCVFKDRTGERFFERLLDERLASKSNMLSDFGTDVLRITGLGKNASSLR